MSLAWGFAGGVGKGLYDVTDQRIKDNMEERRTLRAREAQMDLERYKAGLRREERTEERAYVKEQTAEERTYLGKQSETERAHEMELQRLKGKQTMQQQRAKDGTGGGKKQWEVIKQVDPETGAEKLFQHNEVTGELKPYSAGGAGGGIAYDEAREMAENEAADKAGWLETDETSFKEDGGSRQQFINRRTQEIMGQAPQEISGPQTSQPPGMKQTTVGEAMKGGKSAAEKDKKGAAQRDPNLAEAYMRERGATEEQINETVPDMFPGTVRKGGKWVQVEEAEGEAPRKFRSEKGRKVYEGKRAVAQDWAKGLTLESAKEQFGSGTAMNKYLRKQGYLEYIKKNGTLWNKIFGIMRKLQKPE